MITNFQKWVYNEMGVFFCLKLKRLSERAAKYTTSNPFSLRLYNFKPSINKTWLIFFLLSEKLYAAFALLKIKLNGINAKTNTKEDKVSPWKIPRLFSTSPNTELPEHSITFYFSILFTNKHLIFSATPHKLWLQDHMISFLIIYPSHC